MRWTRRRVQTVTTWVVVVAWAVFYAVALATADPLPPAETALAQLVVPPLLLVVAARLVLRHWWSGPGSRMSTMDLPERLLAAAAAALPERRRGWGRAMTAELAEVQGRSARWRFALSSVRATLWLPPAGGWPVLALVTGVVVAATTAVGPAVGAAVPGLRVFAVTFTGLVGAMAALAVARAPRPRLRLPVPAPTVLVAAGGGGVSRRRAGRLPVGRPGVPAVAGHQPARTPPRRRRRCRVRGLVLAGDPHRRDGAPAPAPARAGTCARAGTTRRLLRPGVRGGAGRPVVPLGPAGRRLDRGRRRPARPRCSRP